MSQFSQEVLSKKVFLLLVFTLIQKGKYIVLSCDLLFQNCQSEENKKEFEKERNYHIRKKGKREKGKKGKGKTFSSFSSY